MQLFNQINARKINDELNVFSGIIQSHLFMYIWILEAGLQVRGALELTLSPLLFVCCCIDTGAQDLGRYESFAEVDGACSPNRVPCVTTQSVP